MKITSKSGLLSPALRARLRPVCVAVTAREADALFRQAEAALRESTFLELRLDTLGDPRLAVAPLRAFCAAHPEAAVLATCRRVEGGGEFRGSVEEQLALLQSFAEAGALLVDVELETLEAARPDMLETLRNSLARTGASLLVSAHDFASTGDPDATLERLHAAGAPAQPAIYKVVTTANSLTDNLRMLRFVAEAARHTPIVGICMGVQGLPSRVLALRAGALFTFASSAAGQATAAGQVSAATLLHEYRAAESTAETRISGVAGNPVGHSLSPALHNAAFRAAGMDAVYLPLHTTATDDLLRFVAELPVEGLSVTMPWKVDVLAALRDRRLGEVSPEAAHIGAINTLVRRPDGSFLGTNTDMAAVTGPLERRIPLDGARVLLLGAGGAARAAAFGLRACGARVAILNRTASAAERLASECGAKVADRDRLRGFDAVVNATPIGMQGAADAELPIDASALEGVRVVFEMVYRPLHTPLTQLARSLGIEVIDGLAMFLEQGMRQWTLWTGRAAPESAMRDALTKSLAAEQT